MIYVFDIDGTICNNTYGEYQKATPFIERIEHINNLYEKGNEIIFFTARGMGRYKGDVEKVHKEFYEFTKNQLDSWKVKYHKLLLGKPSADIFIDDKGIKDEDYFGANICP